MINVLIGLETYVFSWYLPWVGEWATFRNRILCPPQHFCFDSYQSFGLCCPLTDCTHPSQCGITRVRAVITKGKSFPISLPMNFKCPINRMTTFPRFNVRVALIEWHYFSFGVFWLMCYTIYSILLLHVVKDVILLGFLRSYRYHWSVHKILRGADLWPPSFTSESPASEAWSAVSQSAATVKLHCFPTVTPFLLVPTFSGKKTTTIHWFRENI